MEIKELVIYLKKILIPPHPSKNFKIQKYYENEPWSNGVFSKDNLLKTIKNGAYVINFDEDTDVGTHWIASFCRKIEIVYLNSFGVEHVPEEIKELIRNKNIKANIFREQAKYSIMCGYLCMGFIDYMLPGKKCINITSLFSPDDFIKNDSIILRFFKDERK